MRAAAGLVALVALGLACRREPAPEPVPANTVLAGGRVRTYVVHAPATRPAHPPLVIVLHGSTQNGEAMRRSTGGELDTLADAHGFVVMYPDGYRGNWDDCRKAAIYPAHAEHVDDIAFVDALIDRAVADFGVDRTRVFAVGYSNGAQMALRLAFERADRIAGIAVICAGLPTDDNNDCHPGGHAIPALIMDGTDDPLNPFEGGEVRGHRGHVHSQLETAQYFAGLAGMTAPPVVTRLPHRDAADPTWVERSVWSAPGKPEVVLDAIHGGGHVVPQLATPQPELLGRVTHDLDAPAEIWAFFARQAPAAR